MACSERHPVGFLPLDVVYLIIRVHAVPTVSGKRSGKRVGQYPPPKSLRPLGAKTMPASPNLLLCLCHSKRASCTRRSRIMKAFHLENTPNLFCLLTRCWPILITILGINLEIEILVGRVRSARIWVSPMRTCPMMSTF